MTLSPVVRQALIIGGSQRGYGVATPKDTVTGATVASVSVSPPTFSVVEGVDVQNVVATPRSTEGNVVGGKTATWASSNENVATVVSTGALTATVTGVQAGGGGGGVGGVALVDEPANDGDFNGRGWYDGQLLFNSSESYGGGPGSMEARWANAGATAPTGNGMRILFQESDEIVLTYRVKWSSSFVGSGQNYHPHEWQLITNLDDMWIGPSGTHTTVGMESNYNNGLIPRFFASDQLNIDQNNIGVNLVGVSENRGVNGCNGIVGTSHDTESCFLLNPSEGYYGAREWFAPGGVAVSAAAKTSWHEYKWRVKLNTISAGTGQADGVLQCTVDDVLVIDHQDVLLRTGENPNMAFNQLLIKPYIGSGSPVAQSIFYDSITLQAAETPTAPGDTIITATVDGIDGTATVTVLPAVSSVAISPSTVSLAPQGTQAVTASVLDSSGSPVTGRNISWSSNSTGVATVAGSSGYDGLITAQANGTATITATVDGISGTTDVTVSTIVVPPPPSGTTWPNEPPGATIIRDEMFDIGNPSYRGGWGDLIGTGNMVTLTDGDSPGLVFDAPITGFLDPSHPAYRKVGRQISRVGDTGGSSATRILDFVSVPGNWSTFFMGCNVRLPSPHDWHSSNILKFWELRMSSFATSIVEFTPGGGGTSAPFAPGVVDQGSGGAEFNQHDGNFNLALNTWWRLEYLFTRSTKNQKIWMYAPGGTPDLRMNHTHSPAIADSVPAEVFYLFLRGGVGDNTSVESYIDIDWIHWSYT